MSVTERKITIGRSRELLVAHVSQLGSESVPLQKALGRVLREPILCDRALPPFDRVTMDGIAIRLSPRNLRQWTVIGTQYAGDLPLEIQSDEDCVEIMTGAKLPIRADTVIPVEWIQKTGNTVELNSGEIPSVGQFIHVSGSDSQVSDVLVQEGETLGGRHLSIAAAVGKACLSVSRLPKVAYVSTGNELVSIEQTPGEVEIRRSNDQVVAAECAKVGISLDQNRHLRDDREVITAELKSLLESMDIIVFSGGVSMGKADFIPECACACGFDIVFHKVKQKPGGPVLFAVHPNGTVLLGLPGNPLSCMVCARLYLRLVLQIMTGYPVNESQVLVQGSLPEDREKARLQLVKLSEDQGNGTNATVVIPNTSGDMRTVIESDGMVLVPVSQEREHGKPLVLKYFDWRL